MNAKNFFFLKMERKKSKNKKYGKSNELLFIFFFFKYVRLEVQAKQNIKCN